MSTTTTLAELPSLKGSVLGSSEWFEVTQERVDEFARATGDNQWIHVDVDAARQGPFGGTIAHGFLTLSLFSDLWSQVLTVTDTTMGINYGVNKVRFPAPVPVGSKVRLTATLADVAEAGGGLQLTVGGIIERAGGDKPVCVIEALMRYYG
jgi:acyl dehydratase